MSFPSYGDASIDELMNEGVWDLDDSALFSRSFDTEEDWPEVEDDDLEEDLADELSLDTDNDLESDGPEFVDWFHEHAKIYDL